MKRSPTPHPNPVFPGKRRELLREYFLNALTLALLKELGSLQVPATAGFVRNPRTVSDPASV